MDAAGASLDVEGPNRDAAKASLAFEGPSLDLARAKLPLEGPRLAPAWPGLTDGPSRGHSRRVKPLLLGSMLALLACGGQVTSTGDGGPGSGSSSGGSSNSSSGTSSGAPSSSSGTVPVCPNDPPTVGDHCTAPGQEGCAYFTRGACVAYVCDSNSLWQTTPQGC